MKWNTKTVSIVLASLGYELETSPPGGDYDTTIIGMTCHEAPDETLYIRGFYPGKLVTDPDDAEIEMIEVSDGGDSRGGLNSSNTEFCTMYGKAVSALRQIGYNVVPTMDDYF